MRFNKKEKKQFISQKRNGEVIWYRRLHEGMGQAVAERTILRKLSVEDERTLSHKEAEANSEPWRWETWGDVADRVAKGNSLLEPREELRDAEYKMLRDHISKATLLMSGRHLQHGDDSQPTRNAEVFTNCATAATSYLLFYLLLNGSGVGRCYDDDMMLVNWDNSPTLRCVLDENHPDFDYSAHESTRDALHKYCEGRQGRIKRGLIPEGFGEIVEYGRDTLWYSLPDSREGWAKALEIWEHATFEKIHKDKMLILDFSKVRAKNSPIGGMQNRPASGPVPLMNAFMKAATIKDGGLSKWKQALYIDHYFAECVLVGGARRAARMSTKSWRDPDVLDFITIKRPIEYYGKRWEEILRYRQEQTHSPFGFLWSSNNSVTVDEEFWELLAIKKNQEGYMSELAQHARRVFRLVTEASYADGTGEPGLINAHKLVQNNKGWDDLNLGDYVGSFKYQINEDTQMLMQRLARKARKKRYCMITNPCITGDTWVQTSEGPRQVEELIDKPFKAEVDGDLYEATGFWKTGIKPVFKLTTASGTFLRLTNNHKLLVCEESGAQWKELRDIRVGEHIALARSMVTVETKSGNDATSKLWESSEVVSIKPDGIEEVFDCTVDQLHAFDANGILAHNCGEISLLLLGGYCVEGSTRILHRGGYEKIEELVGKPIEVWNGEKWAPTVPFITGTDQKLVRVTLSDGSHLDCTPYHKWSVKWSRQAKHFQPVEAKDLKVGHIVPTFRVTQDIEGNSEAEAYTYGVWLGDGSKEIRKDTDQPRYTIPLYPGKHTLPVSGSRGAPQPPHDGIDVTVSHLDSVKLDQLKEDRLPEWVFQLDRDSALEFVKGWADADGCYHKSTGGISIDTSYHQRALDLQLLLRRLGFSYVSVKQSGYEGEETNLGVRKNDLFRVYIPCSEAAMLNSHRVATDYPLTLDRVVKQARIVKIEELPGTHMTYCFTEPEKHMGVFNNVLTHQCVIADVVPFHADTVEEAEEAFRAATRALIRVNLMDSLYKREVQRTNRIGVGMTGVHEFAWKFFKLGFRDLIDEEKSKEFWLTLARFHKAVREEASQYSEALGLPMPHTGLTIKPAGTTSKLFGLTEGWHLPSLAWYLRWVQFRNDDPLVEAYKAKGYPTRQLKTYEGTTIVGFPTAPTIADLGLGDKLVTAGEASPEEQYKWVQLGEKYWLQGFDGAEYPKPDISNQISYTLKYAPDSVDFHQFRAMIKQYQPTIKCCSVMPQTDATSYEYQPEESLTKAGYEEVMRHITEEMAEDIDKVHIDCENGACPVDFKGDNKPLSEDIDEVHINCADGACPTEYRENVK